MRIVYLTTAWRKQDYAKALSEGKKVPNPAGQNFHRRLMEGLAGQEGISLQVYCLANPAYGYLSMEPHVLKEGSAFAYLPLKSNKLAKLLQTGSIARQIKKDSEAQAVILYDSLSLFSSMVAEKLAKLTSWKRVAICTDNPDNITGSPAYVNAKLLSVSSNADGYFALTKGLAQLFNPSGKPTFFDLGLVEPLPKTAFNQEAPYLYYGGTLFKSYGVHELVQAYGKLNPNFELVLAGHENSIELQELCEKTAKVHLLGQISAEENALYEANAIACINPKPYDERIDLYAVPSKMLEYLRYGKAIISTRCGPIQERFENHVNWIGEQSLEDYLSAHLDKEGNLIGLKENRPEAENIIEELDPSNVARRLVAFLQSNRLA